MSAWNDPDIVIRAEVPYQRLQLPIPTSMATTGRDVLWESFVASFGEVKAEDCLIALDADVTDWLQNLEVSDRLRVAIHSALTATTPTYFENHKLDFPDFVANIAASYALPAQDAVKLGSQLALVKTLAEDFQYSSSSITTILDSKVQVEKLNTYLIQDMGKFIGETSSIDRDSVDHIFDNDTRLSPTFFADAELTDIVEILNLTAETLKMPKIGTYFSVLAAHDPYVQMLHWQTILIEFQDFDPSLLYEFSPRGLVAKHLFEKHEAVGLGTGGNPFLNNAKSAYAADTQWAMQKKPAQRNLAISLSDTLQSLKFQSYQSRKSMATLLRWAIHKLLEIRSNTDQNLIPLQSGVGKDYKPALIESWLTFTATVNTETRGIFEQRCVDYLVACMFQGKDVEIRGLKDSVNASNLSRMKFGDEEVMDVTSATINAYEPHGGFLSQAYVDEHLRSMFKVMAGRRDELEMVAPLTAWTFNVTFVAHDSKLEFQQHTVLDANVNVNIVSYFELITKAMEVGHSPELFDDLVISVLNKPGVGLAVRTKAHGLLS